MAKNKSTAAYFLRIAGVLTLICSVIALMLALVNAVTKDKIAENTEKDKIEAIGRIFGGVDSVEETEADGYEVCFVKKDGACIGYTVTVYPQGYGGEINMLVGIGRDGKIVGVEIISLSETPGVGKKVKTDKDFLTQFTGKSGTLTVGDNVDAISGATISSKAVTAGINEALSVKVAIDDAADTEDTKIEDVTIDTETDAETQTETEPENAAYVTTSAEETHIDPALVGAGDAAYDWEPQDKIDVVSRDTSYYLEHETTDTAEPDSAGA